MMIGDRQQALPLAIAPLSGRSLLALRTVTIPTTMIQRDFTFAVITLVGHAAQCWRMTTDQVSAYLESMGIQWMVAGVILQLRL